MVIAQHFIALFLGVPRPPPPLFLCFCNIPRLYEGIRIPDRERAPYTNLAPSFWALGPLPIRKDACHICSGLGSQFRLGETTLENEVKMPRNLGCIGSSSGGGLCKGGYSLLGLGNILSQLR
jgi:hypothetical protein